MGLRFGISFSCPNQKSPFLDYDRSCYYEIICPQIDGDWLEWKMEDIENFGAKLNFDMELEIRDWELRWK